MGYWNQEYWDADCETTGLLSDLRKQEKPKLHNFCAVNHETGEVKLFQRGMRKELEEWLETPRVFVMHNGICYDGEAMKLFGFDMSKHTFLDTLAISWYLEPFRVKHGLESYGTEFGVEKPPIADWKSLTQEDYNHRVLEDCKIQRRLWEKQIKWLRSIYDNNDVLIEKFLTYLMWKMEQLRKQQENMWRMDVEGATKLEEELANAVEEKIKELTLVMPKVPVFAKRTRPAKPFLKSGDLSAAGLKWKALTESLGLPFEHNEPIKEQVGESEPNPQSPQQVKDWLDSLGWLPCTFKFVKEDDGTSRNIPQINLKGGEVADSVKLLIEKNPGVAHLEGLGILKHRLGMVKGFLRECDEGFLIASAAGFTNTLRMKHSAPLANIPSVRVKYGKEIRSLLLARQYKVLEGSDLCSLEDRLKQHFQWKLDPEYVKTQMAEGYDPHIQVAIMAGLMTEEEGDFYKWYKKNH